jgi:hypothetical protein
MQDYLSNTATPCESADLPKYERRIGSTVYRVSVRFSQESTETIEDKLMRLMESEVRDSA